MLMTATGSIYYTASATTASTDTDPNMYDSSSYISFKDVVLDKTKHLEKDLKIDRKSEFIRSLVGDLCENMGIPLHDTRLGIFCRHKSNIDNDIVRGLFENIYYHKVYPIRSDPQDYDRIYLFSYDICIIVNILEYLPSRMARANIIKEALMSLVDKNSKRLAIIAESEEEVEKSRESEPDITTGFDVKELESLALFAGAKNIIDPGFVKDKDFKDPYIITTNY